jgi:PilZ domain
MLRGLRSCQKIFADSETQLQYWGPFLIAPASKSFAVSENRKNVRLRTLKAGVIAFDQGTISCVVRNISVSGACLEVASPMGIPDSFTLLMESDHIKRQCHVAWMKDKRIGIHFD